MEKPWRMSETMHVDVKLVTSKKEAKKWICKHNFKGFKIYHKNFAAIHMLKQKVVQNKPRYVGFTVLELAKLRIYDMWYNYLKPKYGDNIELLMTDTDSFIFLVKTEDLYKDIAADIHAQFDTSNYPNDHPSGIEVGINKKVPGMFKDECAGKQIMEFATSQPKVYGILMDDGDKVKKCKGIKRNVVQNSVTFQNIKDCVLNRETQMRQMNIIRSRDHNVYSERVNKVALSRKDDKRIILEDGIHTLGHGHYRSKR